MIKAKEASLKNVVSLLIVCLAVPVAFYMSRLQTRTSSIPVFIGEEVTVHQRAIAVKAAPMTGVAEKVMTKAPVIQPLVVAPVPIIPPRILSSVVPEYPAAARSKGIEGAVVVIAKVGISGAVSEAQVKSSSLSAELDNAAVSAVKQWKFAPAMQGASAIGSDFEVPIKFQLK